MWESFLSRVQIRIFQFGYIKYLVLEQSEATHTQKSQKEKKGVAFFLLWAPDYIPATRWVTLQCSVGYTLWKKAISKNSLGYYISTVIPRKLAVPNSRNSQIRGFCYLVAWKPPNWLFTIKMAPYLAVSKFAVPYYPTPKIREFGGITVHILT